ncbi:metallo-beta-lactamase domain-containing protein 1 [Venturia canescens]|uniref:metallo-beta-lactamase domain-containing protein 1 n=1 Tax=Venturia canescens TaxID=32260 RepID=UPI001C9D489A|nr:metallo-beta-lactamase domain-containing protein 1 [Venturia canescens]
MAEVIVLFDGYSKQLDDIRMEANCSCTLVKAEKNIIVDTMTAWDRDKIIKALSSHNIKPEDIDYVVCSHGHSDHTGNNNLFLNAEHIVGLTVHRGTIFYEKNLSNEDYKICEGVRITATPGHTAEDVSVLVDAKSPEGPVRIAITGDLFENESDLEDASIWQNLGNPELRKTQAEMRLKILQMSDHVVPGHGPRFKVTEAIRKMAEDQKLKI